MIKKISHHKAFIKNYVIIDGISRTGKMMLSKIIPTFKNFEQIEYIEFIEYMLAALRFKKISFDFANSFIVTTLNEMSYNKMIGRKQNLRPSDVTSISKFYKKKIYQKRLNFPEGKKVISLLKKNKNFFPLMSHDIMSNYNFFKNFNINFKMIQIYRNPFDIIYSWNKRNWGERFQNDPQPSALLYSSKKKLYPWHVYGREDKWQKKNSVERCSDMVINLIKKSIKNHRSVKDNKKIITISYEDFIQNTDANLFKISKFLNTQKTSLTKKILIREKCPKTYDTEDYLKKKKFIQSKATKLTFKAICKLEKEYKKNIYNLK
tara:strand:+ start:217 stop:1176 length:960 start_codon:yes stop_codon:yes gene_type:complete